ncbi:MAG: hypothetical protein KA352_10790 [Flavobacteriales bacterium]|nr:hypothetical protein [Flavobacteriales bacterium]
MNRKQYFSCVILGAGPSGLAAAQVLSEAKLNFVLVDRGKKLYRRNPNIPTDITSGIGGGGLFSDGKFSLFPSGSAAYILDEKLVSSAYMRTVNVLSQIDVNIPLEIEAKEFGKEKSNEYHRNYESIVLTDYQLLQLGTSLADVVPDTRMLYEHSIVSVAKITGGYSIDLINVQNNQRFTIETNHVIISGGKYFTFKRNEIIKLDLESIFKKLEFGIRISLPKDSFDYSHIEQKDVKLILPIATDCEFRTFCFCRDGYVVHGKFDELHTFNGVSQRRKANDVNFGLNVRLTSQGAYDMLRPDIEGLLNAHSIVETTIGDFLKTPPLYWSPQIHELFTSCLNKHFPSAAQSDGLVAGPSFEYFGVYPVLDSRLRCVNEDIYFTGDATGDFRGLMPAFISGFVAGEAVKESISRSRIGFLRRIRLKPSDTKKRRVVFTAQSKKVFYCKDAICEFVFERECVPINPFMIFGYFLNDRVDRRMVRNGNNELIQRSDELWIFGSISDGVLFEIFQAQELGMPIKYFSVSPVAKEIREISSFDELVFEPEVQARIKRIDLIQFLQRLSSSIKDKTQLEIRL